MREYNPVWSTVWSPKFSDRHLVRLRDAMKTKELSNLKTGWFSSNITVMGIKGRVVEYIRGKK